MAIGVGIGVPEEEVEPLQGRAAAARACRCGAVEKAVPPMHGKGGPS